MNSIALLIAPPMQSSAIFVWIFLLAFIVVTCAVVIRSILKVAWFAGYKKGFGDASEIHEKVEFLLRHIHEEVEKSQSTDATPQNIIGILNANQPKVRARIVDVVGRKTDMPVLAAVGLTPKTPDVSKPHIGKEGWAEYLPDGNVKITLDDGGVLMGYECWWEEIDV